MPAITKRAWRAAGRASSLGAALNTARRPLRGCGLDPRPAARLFWHLCDGRDV